jgi:hypothetical protein
MARPDRIHPDVVVTDFSVNCSSRGGRKPVLIVVHSTEGRNLPHTARDLRGLAAYLGRADVEASAHVCTDGDGHSARMVRDRDKAWACAGFNPVSLNIEQIGYASEVWKALEYKETARWIARWSKMYGIPIRKGAVSGVHVSRSGVVRHSDLGMYGGGHHDPGAKYDLHKCLDLARWYRRYL